MQRKKLDVDIPLPDGQQIKTLSVQADQGDETARQRLGEAMADTSAIWQQAGDLAHMAEEEWLRLITGANAPFAESLHQQMTAMRKELRGPDPAPVEKLLVDRIVVCWLQAQYADLSYAQSTDVSLTQARFLLKRQETSHNRYLASLRALALIRNLLSKTRRDAGRGRNQRKSPPARGGTA